MSATWNSCRPIDQMPRDLTQLSSSRHTARPTPGAMLRVPNDGFRGGAVSRPHVRRSRSLATRASTSDATPTTTTTKHRQSLTFRDARTGVDVCLVGTMHYNPASIELASTTVANLAKNDTLAALVLETCPTRWAKTVSFQPKGSPMRLLLDNEFQAAVDSCVDDDTKIVLGDQSIEDLGESAKAQVKSTVADFINPLNGGWTRLWSDCRATYVREVIGIGETKPDECLRFSDLATDVKLVSSMPLSLFRYPLAWAIKSPKTILPLFFAIYGLAILPGLVPVGEIDQVTNTYVASGPENFVSILFFALDILEVVFLSRLLLKALLETRNDILARSIRDACGLSADSSQSGSGQKNKTRKTVVAILGAAHLNGVQARLLKGGDGVALDGWEISGQKATVTTPTGDLLVK